MSMRTLIGTSLVVVLAGCSAGQIPMGEEAAALMRCPDPDVGCSSPNGTGIYTDEDGHAGIDNMQLMITHFVNKGSSVGFVGRYYDVSSGLWLPMTGAVSSANYLTKKGLVVSQVRESYTIPVWTMADLSNGGAPFPVTGQQLLDLTLIITPNNAVSATAKQYEISWDAFANDTSQLLPVRTFNMKWRVAYSNSAPTQYCFDGTNGADPVVFQQGLYVNPENAKVNRTNGDNVVTLSCRKGSMATVHSWGYPYRANAPVSTFYFDSGLQMKRASYCADSNHFTKPGTLIQIHDDQTIQVDPIRHLESYWTPQGALCLDTMRHQASGFSGTCPGAAAPLPSCVSYPAPFIKDGGYYLLQ
jgi:hypothetical protein